MKNATSPYWVLVADSGCGRFFELRKKPALFRELEKMVSPSQHLTSREMMSDASGRMVNVQGGRPSHTMHPRSDAHDQAEQGFSRKLAEKLGQAVSKNAFEHLVVIADPRTLGRLRQQMSKAVSDRVINELNRDLVALPLDKLEKRVRAELGWPADRPRRSSD